MANVIRIYHFVLLSIWVLAVALTFMGAGHRFQFNLKGLLGLIGVAALGLGALCSGSLVSFAMVLLFTVGSAAWCIRVVFYRQQCDRSFCYAFEVRKKDTHLFAAI
jgi:CHASE2 domain-containing sensor protein